MCYCFTLFQINIQLILSTEYLPVLEKVSAFADVTIDELFALIYYKQLV